jgi:hypothetical protein
MLQNLNNSLYGSCSSMFTTVRAPAVLCLLLCLALPHGSLPELEIFKNTPSEPAHGIASDAVHAAGDDHEQDDFKKPEQTDRRQGSGHLLRVVRPDDLHVVGYDANDSLPTSHSLSSAPEEVLNEISSESSDVESEKEEDCDPSQVDLSKYPQWADETGYWVGQYDFYQENGTPHESKDWNYPYSNYRGFITGNAIG